METDRRRYSYHGKIKHKDGIIKTYVLPDNHQQVKELFNNKEKLEIVLKEYYGLIDKYDCLIISEKVNDRNQNSKFLEKFPNPLSEVRLESPIGNSYGYKYDITNKEIKGKFKKLLYNKLLENKDKPLAKNSATYSSLKNLFRVIFTNDTKIMDIIFIFDGVTYHCSDDGTYQEQVYLYEIPIEGQLYMPIDIANYYDNNETMTKENIKQYNKFIEKLYEIIDEADYLNLLLDNNSYQNYLENVKYIEYDKIYYKETSYNFTDLTLSNILFDIRQKKAKDYCKRNVKFNICGDPYNTEFEIEYHHINCANDMYLHPYGQYKFIKDNKTLGKIRTTGYLEDYRMKK